MLIYQKGGLGVGLIKMDSIIASSDGIELIQTKINVLHDTLI